MSEFKLKPNERDDLVGYAKYLRDAVGLTPEPGMRVQLEGRSCRRSSNRSWRILSRPRSR